MQSRGYYFTRDGRLRSNEGELRVRTTDGIIYTLRFGEVLYGSGETVSAGSDSSDDAETGPGENRYLFITAEFDRTRFEESVKPDDTAFGDKDESEWTDEDRAHKEQQDAHDEWSSRMTSGEERAVELEARFGTWYYVISSASFDEVSPNREDLTKEKPAAAKPPLG